MFPNKHLYLRHPSVFVHDLMRSVGGLIGRRYGIALSESHEDRKDAITFLRTEENGDEVYWDNSLGRFVVIDPDIREGD